jgi:hypothetical protein
MIRMIFVMILGSMSLPLVGLELGSSEARADLCPVLQGAFLCPPRGNNPAFEMKVTQSGALKKTVQYRWEYTQGFKPAQYLASVKAAYNPDTQTYGVCRNRGLYITKNPRDLSDSLRNEVNAVGNYVVTTFVGEPIMTCLRVSDTFAAGQD